MLLWCQEQRVEYCQYLVLCCCGVKNKELNIVNILFRCSGVKNKELNIVNI